MISCQAAYPFFLSAPGYFDISQMCPQLHVLFGFSLCLLTFPAVIQLGDVDLNCPRNCKCHNTHFFGTDRQIVRRGQAFDLYVHFQNREWDDSVDKISFTVETGNRPKFQRLFPDSLLISDILSFATCIDELIFPQSDSICTSSSIVIFPSTILCNCKQH